MADSRSRIGAEWKRRIEQLVEALSGVLRIPSPEPARAPVPVRVPTRRQPPR